MKVMKFGGSSLSSPQNVIKAAEIVRRSTQPVVVVVSAMGDSTNMLVRAAGLAFDGNASYREVLRVLEDRHLQAVRELIPMNDQSAKLSYVKRFFNQLEDYCFGIALLKEMSLKTVDSILSYGELLSSFIVCEAFKALDINAVLVDSREVIITDSNFGNATVNYQETNTRLVEKLREVNTVCVMPGFIAVNSTGITTTLGRGGSDFTAAIVAAAMGADKLELWSDVDGIMTADPGVVKDAFKIEQLSYKEAMELSHFGAKVLYPPTIQPVLEKQIPVYLKNTFNPEASGTVIHIESANSKFPVIGLSCIDNVCMLTVSGSGMIGVPGYAYRLFLGLSKEKINVILITQSCSEQSISLAVHEKDGDRAVTCLNREFELELKAAKVDVIKQESKLSIIALVGENMKNRPGISGKAFGALGDAEVNIRAIAQGSSELNISLVIDHGDKNKALNALHSRLFRNDLIAK